MQDKINGLVWRIKALIAMDSPSAGIESFLDLLWRPFSREFLADYSIKDWLDVRICTDLHYSNDKDYLEEAIRQLTSCQMDLSVWLRCQLLLEQVGEEHSKSKAEETVDYLSSLSTEEMLGILGQVIRKNQGNKYVFKVA